MYLLELFYFILLSEIIILLLEFFY